MSEQHSPDNGSLNLEHKLDRPITEEHHPHAHAGIPEKKKSEYIFIALLCLLVAFGGFVFGWDTGTVGGFTNMPDFKERFGKLEADGSYKLTNVRTGLMISIFNVGCAFGGIFLAPIGDRFGRKIGLMITMIVYIVGILIQITSNHGKWYQYFIGRIISGFAVGSVGVLSPMLIAESSPKVLRGTLVSCYQLMITLGIFLGYCANFGTKSYHNSAQWRIPLGLCFLYAILMFFGMMLMPESPRYLVEVGRIEDARKSIARSNKINVDDPAVFGEIEIIQAAIDKERLAGTASWGELFTGKPKIFYRVTLGVMLQSLQQLTGNNYFFYYGTTVFQAVGLEDSFQTVIILGIVNFISTFPGLYVVDSWGRRKVLLVGAAGMVVCFVVFATLGARALYPNGYDGETSKGAGNGMIVFACFYIFFFAASWGPCVSVCVSETYPIRIRSRAMGVASSANWMWGFLISFFTPFITSAIHFYYGYVFLGCLVFAFFYVYFFLPETKGLSLEEVNELYEENVLPWKSTKWVPSSRRDENAVEEEETDGKAQNFMKRFF